MGFTSTPGGRSLRWPWVGGTDPSNRRMCPMRRISVVLAVLAALTYATPVLAVPGCGSDFDLLSVQASIARVDDRIYTPTEWAELGGLIAAEDKNGDGLLC